MALEPPTASSPGVAFLVSAGIVYEILSATNSSPQTAEINASLRAATLRKWVDLGLMQAIAFIVIAAAVEPDGAKRLAILSGGALGAAAMWLQYRHALAAGLQNGGPITETN